MTVSTKNETAKRVAVGNGIVIIKPRRKEIVCIDLKGGAGVEVYAEDNEQTTMYIGGMRTRERRPRFLTLSQKALPHTPMSFIVYSMKR